MKYIFLTFIALCLSSLIMGCAGFTKSYKKSSKSKEERLTLIDQKVGEIEQAISNLNASSQNLERRFEELSQKTANTDANYSKLHTALANLNSKIETKDNSLENSISETKKNIDDLEEKLTKIEEIEKVKTDLQNQIIVLLSQRPHITSSDIGQLREEAKEMLTQGRETIKETQGEKQSEEDKKIEALAENRNKEALQNMLDEALELYREGSYKESIRKWEEVLVIDPENLEAKFNIEIAKEKLKSLSEK